MKGLVLLLVYRLGRTDEFLPEIIREYNWKRSPMSLVVRLESVLNSYAGNAGALARRGPGRDFGFQAIFYLGFFARRARCGRGRPRSQQKIEPHNVRI
jgi:hypothetical protein